MLIAIIAHDKPGALQTRLDNRDAHLAYARETGVVAQAGPIMDDDGNMAGSILVLDVDDIQAARDWAANDPYAKAGLFADTQILRWNRVIG